MKIVLVTSLFICDRPPNDDMRSARIVKPRKHLVIKQLQTPNPKDSQEILGRVTG
jgi:hypothetical protein